jgi:hypothetical protein
VRVEVRRLSVSKSITSLKRKTIYSEKAKISKRKLENIYVDSFLGEIRQDTMLSLIDIPGLNEADAEKRKEI